MAILKNGIISFINVTLGYLSARSYAGNLLATAFAWYQVNYTDSTHPIDDTNEFVLGFIVGTML